MGLIVQTRQEMELYTEVANVDILALVGSLVPASYLSREV
jgi:hypothetical protein